MLRIRNQIKDPDLIFPGQRFVIPEIPAPKEKNDKKEKGEGVKEDTGQDKKDATESTDTTNDTTNEE